MNPQHSSSLLLQRISACEKRTAVPHPIHLKPKHISAPPKEMWKVSLSATGPCCCISPPIPTSISFHSPNHNTTTEEKTQSFKNKRPQNTQITTTKNPTKRVFFLDVNPLCYNGTKPSLPSFTHWVSLFFSQVSLQDPVIAVLDGEGGSEFRRQILPSYKAHRKKFIRNTTWVSSHTAYITHILENCNVPVIRMKGWEADDVVASLVDQVLKLGLGFRVVVGSPDKDFKQLISEDVQVVMPAPKLGRWSFYTMRHYMGQYKCDPSSDLSLRCILGDEVDGVPGIQHLAPGFGRKTALKLLKKHGSLEKLLEAAAVRTVGKQYAQDALVEHADYLRKNYEVLRLRKDVDVHLEEEWLTKRDNCNDSVVLSSRIRNVWG